MTSLLRGISVVRSYPEGRQQSDRFVVRYIASDQKSMDDPYVFTSGIFFH